MSSARFLVWGVSLVVTLGLHWTEPVLGVIWINRHLYEEAVVLIRFTGTYLGLYDPASWHQFNQ